MFTAFLTEICSLVDSQLQEIVTLKGLKQINPQD